LYIGTAATDNNYVNFSGLSGKAATNFAYYDYSITGYCSADLSFNWKCLGKSTDYLSVWVVPTTVTPVAGTALVASASNIMVGGPYWNAGSACNSVTISLSQFVGQTIRLVYCWQNTAGSLLTGNTAASPAALVDDIVVTQTDAYSYSWTSSPAGLNSTFQSITTTPTLATTYSLVVTRCDGCVSAATTSVGTCAILPIELISFTGKCKDNITELEWVTASEINNNYVVIERSSDAHSWSEITRVYSKGNNNAVKHYDFSDTQAFSGTSYYRLIQVDNNQNAKIAGIITTECTMDIPPSVSYYPNPVPNKLIINVKNVKSTEAVVTLFDMLGQKVNEMKINSGRLINGETEIDISFLSAGAYYVCFESQDFRDTKKIIKTDE
jgi:hypothetical protein